MMNTANVTPALKRSHLACSFLRRGWGQSSTDSEPGDDKRAKELHTLTPGFSILRNTSDLLHTAICIFPSISETFGHLFTTQESKTSMYFGGNTTFCRCIMFSKSPNGDSSGLSKASKASVRSISVRHSLLSSPCSANWVWANSRAASVSRCRISSIRCCCYIQKTRHY